MVNASRLRGLLNTNGDKKFTWESHINYMIPYSRSSLRAMYHLRKLCSLSTLKKMYYGIFQSKIQYGLTCWCNAYMNIFNKLRILEKSAVRIISCWHSFTLFKNLNILTLRHLYCYKVLKVFFVRSGYLFSISLDGT